MKKLLAVPLILAASVASADQSAYVYGFDRVQETDGSGYTHNAYASYAYNWDYLFTLQADTSLSRYHDSAHNDNSFTLHASYYLNDSIRIGGYLGWEEFDHEASNFLYHGFEFEIQGDGTSINVFGGKDGDDGFPATDNVQFGATIKIDASDRMTLVGRGLLRDNDALDLFTTVIGAGIDYDLANGITLSGEIVDWNRKVSGTLVDSGLGISLGASMSVGRDGILMPQRNSVTNTFGSPLKYAP